jgi:hypothetical protein
MSNLNKYEKEWLVKLMSGNTRKTTGVLASRRGGNGRICYCCLGVAERVCDNDDWDNLFSRGTMTDKTNKKIRLRTIDGQFVVSTLSKKWQKEIRLDFRLNNKNVQHLTTLNDVGWSHVKIGNLVNENREAFFKQYS